MSRLRRQLDGLNDKTLREGFWDDPAAAKQLLSERANLEQTIGRYDGLTRELTDMGELLELAEGERDASMIDEVGRRTGIAPEHAYILASLTADLVVSEVVDAPNWVVSLHLPLAALD